MTCDSPSFSRPTPRTSEGLAYDFDTQDVVLFGGVDHLGKNSETWHLKNFPLEGIHWAQLFPTNSPSKRGTPELAFLNKSGVHQMILFGGNVDPADTVNDETWLWDGTIWQQLFPANKPSARFGHRMVYDDALQEIVLFGASQPTFMNDLWFWDGTTWTICGSSNGCTTTPPLPRCCVGMAYDQAHQTVVVYAGSQGVEPNAYPDTWLWDPTLSWRCVHNCGL